MRVHARSYNNEGNFAGCLLGDLVGRLLRDCDMRLPDEQIIFDLVFKLKILLAWLLRDLAGHSLGDCDMRLPDEQEILELSFKT